MSMLTQTIATTLPETLFAWALRRAAQLHGWLYHMAVRQAGARAYRHFARQFPQWADSLFDEHFISGPAAPLLARYALSPTPSAPADLALAWFAQICAPQAPATPNLSEVGLVAAAFLQAFERELRRELSSDVGVVIGLAQAR
jgi:hypothetical protein